MALYFERKEPGKRVGCKNEVAVWIFMEGSKGRSVLKCCFKLTVNCGTIFLEYFCK